MKQDARKPTSVPPKPEKEVKGQKTSKAPKTEKPVKAPNARPESARREKKSSNEGSPKAPSPIDLSPLAINPENADQRKQRHDSQQSSPSLASEPVLNIQITQQFPNQQFLIPDPTPTAQMPCIVNYAVDMSSGEYRPSNYKTRLCIKWEQMGECSFGDRCNFAHGEHELRCPSSMSHEAGEQFSRQSSQPGMNSRSLPPNRKTRLCSKFNLLGVCPYGERCNFAHGMHELMPSAYSEFSGAPPAATRQNYKTRLCLNWQQDGGHCPYGNRCHFAHGLHELRVNGMESFGFAPPPPPLYFCSLVSGPPMGHMPPDMSSCCPPMGPPFCNVMPPMGSMGMGMGMPPPPGAMMQMSTCGFMGQQMRVCQGNEMRQIQSGESGEGSDAGGTPELPQAVQRLFAAYENQPCAPVPFPPGPMGYEGWGVQMFPGPAPAPVHPAQQEHETRNHLEDLRS